MAKDTKKAFTLIELLVVISILGLLLAMLMPALSRAREMALIVTANAELFSIGRALEAYALDNEEKFPPTRADCNPDAREHAYALPQELVDSKYLPGGKAGRICFANIEDRFNLGCTYKYIAVGKMYDYLGTPLGNQYLRVPDGFPDREGEQLNLYDNPQNSPVSWVLFSLGPRYDKEHIQHTNFPLKNGFPILREYWYNPTGRKGILTRIRSAKGQHVGSF